MRLSIIPFTYFVLSYATIVYIIVLLHDKKENEFINILHKTKFFPLRILSFSSHKIVTVSIINNTEIINNDISTEYYNYKYIFFWLTYF